LCVCVVVVCVWCVGVCVGWLCEGCVLCVCVCVCVVRVRVRVKRNSLNL